MGLSARHTSLVRAPLVRPPRPSPFSGLGHAAGPLGRFLCFPAGEKLRCHEGAPWVGGWVNSNRVLLSARHTSLGRAPLVRPPRPSPFSGLGHSGGFCVFLPAKSCGATRARPGWV